MLLTKYTDRDIFGRMNILPSTLYPAIAHETRLRCLLLLLEHHELCVCELTHAIGAAQPTISRHLAHLREAELVSDRREGLWIHYRINPELPAWVTNVLRETANGVEGVAPFTEDLAALENMPNRPGAPRCA
jgi:ArsR family transcriptional regulator